jgi:hypothetical protein
LRDRQVEVVSGNHVVVRVAGVVVLVGHRDGGPVREDSPAMRAAEALAQLVFTAAEQSPGAPGRLIAREATNWLLHEAEQISPGARIDLGIVSPAESGGVAIFLHGAVTAVLAGERGVEYVRGAEAAFTVDRVAEPPARAVAIVLDEPGRDPELPERGIGALVEGVAPAGGAIIWFEPRRSRARDRDAGAGTTGEQSPPAGSGPAGVPPPDPALRGRVEETERAAPLTVRVLGFKCARAHPSDPRAAFCTVCGMPVDQTQQPSEVLRPPLGTLVLDDGTTLTLVVDAVLGRDPQHSDAAQRGMMPFKIEDNSGGMSRAHAEIRLVNWDVTIVDRGSTNGTSVRPPGYDWIRLQPNQPMALMYGTEIHLGNRMLRLDPAAPPPFG